MSSVLTRVFLFLVNLYHSPQSLYVSLSHIDIYILFLCGVAKSIWGDPPMVKNKKTFRKPL